MLISVLLVVGVLIQGGFLLRRASLELVAIRAAIGQTGRWRSANFFQNQRFADYVDFLIERIPEDAHVVLAPVKSGPKTLGVTPFMQFFLAPRQVINCTDEECLDNLSMDNTYVVFTDGALAAHVTENHEQVLMFDESWGVVAPKSLSSQTQNTIKGFGSLLEIMLAAIWPIVWLLLMTVAGILVVQHLVSPLWSVLIKSALGYGLALGVFSLSAAASSLAGVPLKRDTVFLLTALLFVGALVFFFMDRRYGQTGENARRTSPSNSLRLDPWQVVFLVLGGIAFLISVGKGYHSTDAILLWGAKGYGIAATGTIKDVTAWGTNTVPYPLNIPILIGSLKLLFTDVLPASKMIFSGYYIGLLFVIYHMLLCLGSRQPIAGLATLLVGTAPLVFRHATIGYANLAMSFYLIAAIFLLSQSLDNSKTRRTYSMALLSGLFFAFASWTRPEALALSGLTITLIFGITYIRRRNSFPVRQLAYVVIPLMLYGLFWLLIKDQVYSQRLGKTDLVTFALMSILSGDLHLSQAYYVLRSSLIRLLSFKTWGLLGVALSIVVIASMAAFAKKLISTNIILWSGTLTAAMILGIYYLVSYDNLHDMSWWVSTGLDRMYFPGVILLWVGGISSIKLLYDDK